MKPERWAVLKELLLRTADLDDENRRAYLDQACANDPELRQEAERILGHERGTHRLLNPEILLRLEGSDSDRGDLVGRTISHYRILARLGAGGMGEVYKAEDVALRRPVALKFLHPDVVGRGEMKARFVREAQSAAALYHPNICTLYAIEEWEGQLFLSMALIDGITLKERVGRGALDPDEVVRVAVQVLSALEAAHGQGIVHRDIKSANIMLANDGRALILDFGLAHSAAHPGLHRQGAVMGTVGYMSPEQARGESVDARTDLWSVGVVMYEMLTGGLPFRGDDDAAVLRSILQDVPPELSATSSGAASGSGSIIGSTSASAAKLLSIVRTALAKDRSQRYSGAAEMLRDLRSVEEGARAGSAGPSVPRGSADEAAAPRPSAVPRPSDAMPRPSDGVPRSSDAMPRPSVAVLAFANLSGDPAHEYFCDGLAEELIHALAHIQGLRVVARTSSFSFKGKDLDIREIGERLGVGTVVEGSVQMAGRRFRVRAQLVNVSDGGSLWSERYDRDLDDLFAIQDDIALAIVGQIQPRLVHGEREKLLKRHADDPETYRLYLNGIYHNRKGGQAGLRAAFEFYGQAVHRDPGFALAYASLSVAQNDWVIRGYPPEEATFESSRENALCAVELDEQCARAHVALGLVKRVYEWDWSGSEREFRRALELNPNEPAAHTEYAALLAILGRGEEAVQQARLGAELEPVALTYLTPVGSILWTVRRFEEAIEQLNAIVSIEPQWGQAHYYLVRAYAALGRFDRAKESLAKIFELWGRNSRCIGMQALVHAAAGEEVEAKGSLDELLQLQEKESISPYFIAIVYAQLGDHDRAFEYLSRVVSERPRWWPFPKTDSMLDCLHSDKRWARLLLNMGLEGQGEVSCES